MYCSTADLSTLLPEPITIGDTNIGTPSPGRPTSNKSVLTPNEAIKYIRLSEQQIDARLRPYYVVPLRRVKSFETTILENVSKGNEVEIKVNDSGVFSKGQLVRIQKSDNMETQTISEIVDLKTIKIERIKYDYFGYESKISILEFPDPIPLITARMAVGIAFDQLFSADNSPNISEYGKEQKRLANNDIDSILSGTILLFGQDHTGKRFVRGSLFDAYQNPTPDFQFGREKS